MKRQKKISAAKAKQGGVPVPRNLKVALPKFESTALATEKCAKQEMEAIANEITNYFITNFTALELLEWATDAHALLDASEGMNKDAQGDLKSFLYCIGTYFLPALIRDKGDRESLKKTLIYQVLDAMNSEIIYRGVSQIGVLYFTDPDGYVSADYAKSFTGMIVKFVALFNMYYNYEQQERAYYSEKNKAA